jgi:hypothetical protein
MYLHIPDNSSVASFSVLPIHEYSEGDVNTVVATKFALTRLKVVLEESNRRLARCSPCLIAYLVFVMVFVCEERKQERDHSLNFDVRCQLR